MTAIRYLAAFLFLGLAPLASFAAGAGVTVRAIGFTGIPEKGKTDAALAPYEGILKSTLPYESFRSSGSRTTTVPPGSSGTLSAGGASIRISVDGAGRVRAEYGPTTVELARPAVFMTGQNTGVIVMRN